MNTSSVFSGKDSSVDDAFLKTAEGLTKRELFAVMVLQGLLGNGREHWGEHQYARTALSYADVLLELLAKP